MTLKTTAQLTDPIEILDARLIEDIRWVRLALGPKHSRWDCRWLHSIDDHLIATDGFRIHAVRTTYIPQGLFQIIKNTKRLIRLAEIEDAVNVSKMRTKLRQHLRVSSRKMSAVKTYTIDVSPVTEQTANAHVWKLIQTLPDAKIGYDCTYLREALFANQASPTTVDIDFGQNDNPLRIRGATRTAVVNGMRV